MDYTKRRLRRNYFFPLFIIMICSAIFITSGCTPLRKKFTRKKKKDKGQAQEFIPVLDPIDYVEKTLSAEQHYRHHYSLWKVWDRDFLQTLERDGSEKRQKYLLGKSIAELEEMKGWLAEEKRAELAGLIQNFQNIQKEYDKPSSMRSKFSMRKSIEQAARKVRNSFSPKNTLPYR